MVSRKRMFLSELFLFLFFYPETGKLRGSLFILFTMFFSSYIWVAGGFHATDAFLRIVTVLSVIYALIFVYESKRFERTKKQ